MHDAAYRFVQSVVHRRPAGRVVEFGGRNVNGSIRSLFDGDPYLSIDREPGPGVDVVMDAARFTSDYPAACVVCCEVLEHAINAHEICANAHRLLQEGGIFILTAATVGRMAHSAVDGGALRAGEFYANVDRDQLLHWLAPFKESEIVTNPETCDIYAVAVK